MIKKTHIISLFLIIILLNSCQLFKKSTELSKTNEPENTSTEQTAEATADIDVTTDNINESIDELYLTQISGDSTDIANNILDDTSAFAQSFDNKFGTYDNIEEDVSMLSGSALVRQLDSLTTVKFYQKYEFISDPKELNVYGYEPNEIPTFNDSIYELRIEMLNIQTPVELVYNSHVKAFINLYAKRGRKQTARMLGLKEIYFPLFEETLDKYDMPLELK